MEGRLNAPWSALDQPNINRRAIDDSVQRMPGMYPTEYEPFMGATPGEIHELPGTASNEVDEDVSKMKFSVDLETSDIRSPKPPRPPKPSKLSAKYSSTSRKDTKSSGGPSSNNIVIAVFGLTGTGKSSFISKLTGKDLQIGHGLQSCKPALAIFISSYLSKEITP